MSSKQPPSDLECWLKTAGGRIVCLRCTAISVRTGRQCSKPAMKSSRTQKCTHHGGRSTGPKTAEGKQRSRAVHLKDGTQTSSCREEYSRQSGLVSMLEDCVHVLGMTDAKRRRGRKSNSYRPLLSIEDVRTFLESINTT